MFKAYTYILQCIDGHLYVGSTKDLDKRLQEHNNGQGAEFTRKRLPVELVYFEGYSRIDYAYFRERQIKKWSKSKKFALINSHYDKLRKLAECRNNTKFIPDNKRKVG